METLEFKIVKTIFAIAFMSMMYLVMVFGFQIIDGEKPDTLKRIIFGIISFVMMWMAYSKIERFAQEILGQSKKNLEKGGGLEDNSLQD